MTSNTDEALRRMSAASGTSPELRTDPRAVQCECGRLLYPWQLCSCRWHERNDRHWSIGLRGVKKGWEWTND